MNRRELEAAVREIQRILDGQTDDRFWYACQLGEYQIRLDALNRAETQATLNVEDPHEAA